MYSTAVYSVFFGSSVIVNKECVWNKRDASSMLKNNILAIKIIIIIINLPKFTVGQHYTRKCPFCRSPNTFYCSPRVQHYIILIAFVYL